MSIESACPHGIEGGCPSCIMRKGNTIAAALAMLPIRRPQAEHRAELLKLQDDLLQAANREVMTAALIERLRGELCEAARKATLALGLAKDIDAAYGCACDFDGEQCDCGGDGTGPAGSDGCWSCQARDVLAAPPPAESTPVPRPRCGGWRQMEPPERAHLDERTFCDIEESSAGPGCKGTCPMWESGQQPTPPDDIRERLERLELRMNEYAAALEAKGEPGTHAFVFDGYHAVTRHCRTCGHPDGPPHHPKGAKP